MIHACSIFLISSYICCFISLFNLAHSVLLLGMFFWINSNFQRRCSILGYLNNAWSLSTWVTPIQSARDMSFCKVDPIACGSH